MRVVKGEGVVRFIKMRIMVILFKIEKLERNWQYVFCWEKETERNLREFWKNRGNPRRQSSSLCNF